MNAFIRLLSMAFVALFCTLSLSSCDAIGSIFKAGAYTGIIGVVLVVVLAIWLFSRLFGRRG